MQFSKLTENQKFLGACIAIFMLGTGSAIASTGNAPDTVVTKLNTALIHSMKMGPSSSYENRFHALYPEMIHAYDFSKIAHYSLGTAWDKLSAPEKKQFVQALTHYSVANYAAHFTHYAGQKFSSPVSKSVPGHRMMVSTTLKSGNGGKNNTFDYLLSQNHGQWKIVNVMTDGVSNLAMQKAEFTGALKKGGIHALMNGINKRSEMLAHAAR
ncbi:ABC transporter substrate-binding protein [Acidithiobacillus thiooxidans]|uniref:Uncharacterized protein n=1 Tax=Acidithiobacillus thiooxidans ATCC 19377 TaxID=637390 RepID=A0A543PZ93_ACITH|nr:ABC transporter substrate-binding protein [Acidithiobacillus thiooxidans]MDX5936612.1 ABC transporter substrate-binding protein [Acidithiobacillus thiooxidans]TQN49350.1 hypothetical protein DLNHIDIE_03398 [Acidithiobacillus thiooxidans ATCC 19377]